MTNPAQPTSEDKICCENCQACCCRQEAMLFNDTQVPAELVVATENGEQSMLRLEDGWCVALDRKTMRCTIYEIRPWICREFEMGEYECLEARTAKQG